MCIACGRTAGKVRFGRLHAQGHGEFARVARSQTQSEVRVTLISIRGEAGGGVIGGKYGIRSVLSGLRILEECVSPDAMLGFEG